MEKIFEMKIVENFFKKFPMKFTEKFEAIENEKKLEIFDNFSTSLSGKLLLRLSSETAVDLLINCKSVSHLSKNLDPAEIARILSRGNENQRNQIIKRLSSSVSKEVKQVLDYPLDSAGALMTTEISIFHPEDLVKNVVAQLKKKRGKNISSIFLADYDGVLQGRVYLQDLVVADENALLKELSKSTPWVGEMSPRDEIVEVVEKNLVPSLPVLSSQNVVLGIIRHEDLISIAQKDALEGMQTMVGVSKDEKALSKPLFSVKKRLPWLSINLLTTFVAAFVVGIFEDTISKITALAILLPVVAGQSGNTGAQSQAITMRGLALREIRLRHKWKVLFKEGLVGLYNGFFIGALCSLSVFFWSQSLPLAAVIGVSMVFAMFAASLSGAAIPMILTAMNQDPATSSSIILTTVTDIVGFLSFLGLATVFSEYLIS